MAWVAGVGRTQRLQDLRGLVPLLVELQQLGAQLALPAALARDVLQPGPGLPVAHSDRTEDAARRVVFTTSPRSQLHVEGGIKVSKLHRKCGRSTQIVWKTIFSTNIL